MNILEEIVTYKRSQVAEIKELVPIKKIEQSVYFHSDCVSMKEYLQRKDKVGIIAEIKRSSPSTGFLNEHINVEELSIGYMQQGATALSVLTDEKYFRGCAEDLKIARTYNYCPILRKDFIIDEYQIIEAKSIGADCILLIAACLTVGETKNLIDVAHSLGLEVLLEVSKESEILSHGGCSADIIGVNNRSLETFETNIERSLELYEKLPSEIIKVSESGISSAEQIVTLKKIGFHGFLIGGYFMKHSDPTIACGRLVHDVQKLMS